MSKYLKNKSIFLRTKERVNNEKNTLSGCQEKEKLELYETY